MKSLLYLRLLTDGQTIAYGNPVLEQVKKDFPEVAVLDADSQSGELVLHYAQKLLQEPGQTIVCFDSAAADAGFGSLLPLIELLLEGQPEQRILFRNTHHRLLRMVQARPELHAELVQHDAELLQKIKLYLT
ncbi:MAG TPA: hypothetical protein VIG72_11150 [Pontibacter sp.]